MKFYNAGQVCASPTRFFIHSTHHDAFVEEIASGASAVKVGPGSEASTAMGPLVHSGRVEAMEALVSDAKEKGAQVVTGGSSLGNRGHFFAPTVLTDVPDTARIMIDEPFGPVVPVQRFDDLDSALTKANSSQYGLAAYAFTQSRAAAELISRKLETGMVAINSLRLGFSQTPFGGIKQSGYGLENGAEGLSAFQTTKFVSENNLS